MVGVAGGPADPARSRLESPGPGGRLARRRRDGGTALAAGVVPQHRHRPSRGSQRTEWPSSPWKAKAHVAGFEMRFSSGRDAKIRYMGDRDALLLLHVVGRRPADVERGGRRIASTRCPDSGRGGGFIEATAEAWPTAGSVPWTVMCARSSAAPAASGPRAPRPPAGSAAFGALLLTGVRVAPTSPPSPGLHRPAVADRACGRAGREHRPAPIPSAGAEPRAARPSSVAQRSGGRPTRARRPTRRSSPPV